MQRSLDLRDAKSLRFIDLFCGIGGFRQAMENLSSELRTPVDCVFSSDIDEKCQESYAANFGDRPLGDITKVNETSVPAHDLLLAGFPCQPFSIIGQKRGFEDTRGTLFFDIARILKEKKPAAFVLENVKMLEKHDKGRTLARILETIHDLGYESQHAILNALDFGLPQKRERIFIVGCRPGTPFQMPKGGVPRKPLDDVLEQEVDRKHFASEQIRSNRLSRIGNKKDKLTREPTIWHENKSGEISAKPYACALRAGASYNYLLVNGERRLTSREMFRLQGFPDSYRITAKDYIARKQAGNSVAVPVVEAVIRAVFAAHGWDKPALRKKSGAATRPKKLAAVASGDLPARPRRAKLRA